MNKCGALAALNVCTFLWCALGWAAGEIRLPSVISDNMVLQQQQNVPIWGWAEPGEKVTVTFENNRVSGRAGHNGEWRVFLAPMEACAEPATMTVSGERGSQVTVNNVLVGEVWLGSGQSNMEWPLRNSLDGGTFVAEATMPDIRLLKVPHGAAAVPVADVEVQWKECTPDSAKDFSAVLYQFGRQLKAELGVPIGLIDCSWGGTTIRAWIPKEGFDSHKELAGHAEWLGWYDDLRARAAGLDLTAADAFLHDILKTVEESKAKPYWTAEETRVFQEAGREAHSVFASWVDRARHAAVEGTPPPEIPYPSYSIVSPTLLYNAMIHPLIPFAIRGALWYQGESDCGAGLLYSYLMKGLITGWREAWQEGDFPFYYVQVAPYQYSITYSSQYHAENLPQLWEAQTAALSMKNTGMVVTNDIGCVGDVHPLNKHEVGRRLMLWALAHTYGRKEVICSGPTYDSYTIDGNSIRIRFTHIGSGLSTRDGKPPTWFTIAGKDGKFVPATAVIKDNTVIVSSDNVANPAAVRFGWHETAEPNLINREGLPAAAFRTDR